MENSISKIQPAPQPSGNVGTTTNTRLMVVKMKCSQWYPRKYDAEISKKIAEDYGVANAERAGRYNKLLISAESIRPLQQAFGYLKDNIHYKYTLPWADVGERVLPVTLQWEYAALVREQKEKIEALVQEFAFGEYRQQREQAKLDLNGMFRESDYPPAAEVADRFEVRVKYTPLVNPDDVRVWGIGDEAAAEIEADVRADMEAATDEAHQVLVGKVIKRAKEFIAKVSLYDARIANDEKGVRLHDTAIENLRDVVIMVLKGLNVKDDTNLTALAKQLNGLLSDATPDTLKHSAQQREDKTKAVEKTLAKFEGVYGA